MPSDTKSALSSKVLALTSQNQKQQIRWRRYLHQNPEISYQEHNTTKFLRSTLDKLGLRLLPLKMETGVLAELPGTGKGPVVAVRSDIDALPIGERSGVSYASRIDGCMHACGHDMHMATVLGVAWVLKKMAGQFPGRVRFLFQPAEEMPPGGALPMIQNGALKNVSMIFGLHVDPHLATGQIGLRDGITMASVLDFDLIVTGRAGHAARPQDAVDAIATAAEIVESLQKVISREVDPVAPAVITFGKIAGGQARNIIAEEVVLTGTARSLSVDISRQLPQKIKRTAQAVARAHGARCEMKVVGEYPLFVNDPAANAIIRRSYHALYPKGHIKATPQVLGGEDFARYIDLVPGAMFRLGIRNRRLKADKPWHSPYFIADEAALEVGTAVLATALLDRLTEGE